MSCSVHDIVDLEGRGVPGVMVASTEFVDAARAQGEALGMHPAAVYVPHPIQDRTDPEMERLAEAAIDQVMAALRSGAGDLDKRR
jgi:hypothetical protein